MNYSDESLMAYVDGEVDGDMRRAIDAAMAADPALAARVAQQRALVNQLRAAYGPVVAEPIPARLLETVHQAVPVSDRIAAPGKVFNLDGARAKKAVPAASGWSWQMLGGIAASLVIGVMLGRGSMPAGDAGMISAHDGQLLARGTLAAALDAQPAGDAGGAGPVKIGLSYSAKSGAYCRAFMLKDGAGAGLACRDQGAWRIQLLTREKTGGQTGAGYRMAGSALPESILRLIDADIAGEALDTTGEQAAIQRGWQAPRR
ncbi:MAG TPA: hypothetical protein VF928_08025 [Usitatibacteraceae bacterium]